MGCLPGRADLWPGTITVPGRLRSVVLTPRRPGLPEIERGRAVAPHPEPPALRAAEVTLTGAETTPPLVSGSRTGSIRPGPFRVSARSCTGGQRQAFIRPIIQPRP